ncbi:MAG: DUF924 family protein [Rhodospirillaceae bacterium]
MEPRARAIIDFWFSEKVVAEQLWFRADDAFDRSIRDGFATDYEKAADGQYDRWRDAAESTLALLIALDQFPRNLFRGTARAFESDAKAQQIAALAVERGFDAQVAPHRRLFFYMPFQHAEDPAMQKRSVELIKPLENAIPGVGYYADRHAALITAFRRFPHRNAALGRTSTPAEMEYLAKTPNEFG